MVSHRVESPHPTFHKTRALQKITVTPISTNINHSGNFPANLALSGAASTPPTISSAITSQCNSEVVLNPGNPAA